MSTSPFALPRDVDTELTRIERRWRELALGRAEIAADAVRKVMLRYAAALAPGIPVPDLGVAALSDQLRVVTYDALAAGAVVAAEVVADLADIRRKLP